MPIALPREVFWTDGTAAHVRRDGMNERLAPSAESKLVDVNLDPPFPNKDAFLAARMLADEGFIEQFRPRVVSTTLAAAWVAAGRRAAYVTDGHLRDSVHFSAGIALCQAAGCGHWDRRSADSRRCGWTCRGRRRADACCAADSHPAPARQEGLSRYPPLDSCGCWLAWEVCHGA